MTALLHDLHPPGGWTTDHLDELPEDGHRYEQSGLQAPTGVIRSSA